MKKMLAIILIIVLALPVVSIADLLDLSGLSFEELVQLRDQINALLYLRLIQVNRILASSKEAP